MSRETPYETPKTLELMKELFVLDEETGYLYNRINRGGGAKAGERAGSFIGNGYRRVHFRGRNYREHRVVFAFAHGRWPNEYIDHINGVRDDNRPENLREVSQQENTRNRKLCSNNTSGISGVKWDKRQQRWRAQLNLGYFDTIFEAACARKSAERRYGYHENHGRCGEE